MYDGPPVVVGNVYAGVGGSLGESVVPGNRDDRCLLAGVGRDADGQNSQWHLVPADGVTSHKHAGDARSVFDAQTFSTSPVQTSCVGENRQLIDSGLYQPGLPLSENAQTSSAVDRPTFCPGETLCLESGDKDIICCLQTTVSARARKDMPGSEKRCRKYYLFIKLGLLMDSRTQNVEYGNKCSPGLTVSDLRSSPPTKLKNLP